jgi:positive regulator of sigma E activity
MVGKMKEIEKFEKMQYKINYLYFLNFVSIFLCFVLYGKVFELYKLQIFSILIDLMGILTVIYGVIIIINYSKRMKKCK